MQMDRNRPAVSRILRRLGLNRIAALEPCEPVRRYERQQPGEMIHIDIKKLGRIDGIGHRITGDRRGQSNRRARGEGIGWEFVHVAIDDNSRIAFAKVMPNERKRSATAFLRAALVYSAGSARGWASNTLGPSPIRRPRPTARPSASSRLACESGLMRKPIITHAREPQNCPTGCTATTGTDLMPASMIRSQSADLVCQRTTC